jgi:hypothetical protein
MVPIYVSPSSFSNDGIALLKFAELLIQGVKVIAKRLCS